MEVMIAVAILLNIISMPCYFVNMRLKPYKATLKSLRDTDEVIPVQKMKKLVRHKSYDLDETRWTDEHEILTV
jgi:hypothetical protein